MRAAVAIGRRLAVSVGSRGCSRRFNSTATTAASTSTSTSSVSSSGRKRLAKFKPVSNTVLDSRDLAVSESGDGEDYGEEQGEEEEDEEEEDEEGSPSHLPQWQQRQRQQQQLQQHSSRALRASLLATQTLRAQRKSTQEIAASPTRFPLTGTFAFDGGSKEAGGEGGRRRGDPSAPPLLLSAREVISAVSPFVSEERLRRIREVARARSFTVLPIVEGLFDRGNLGAVCRTVSLFGGVFFFFGLE